MRLRIFTILFFALIFSCKAKDSAADVETDLTNAMKTYLYNDINNDSSNIKYRIEKVIYFEDKDKYICEFTVNVKAKLFDTTGIMKADITKDFKKVNRFQ
jgi:hypothetical protein